MFVIIVIRYLVIYYNYIMNRIVILLLIGELFEEFYRVNIFYYLYVIKKKLEYLLIENL